MAGKGIRLGFGGLSISGAFRDKGVPKQLTTKGKWSWDLSA
jgi:hypothetical protein